MSLTMLAVGQKAKIAGLEAKGKTLIRFMEMGLRANEIIQMIGKLPFGGNLVILSDYGKYILRKKEAQLIKIKSA